MRGRGSPLKGAGVCIGGVVTLRFKSMLLKFHAPNANPGECRALISCSPFQSCPGLRAWRSLHESGGIKLCALEYPAGSQSHMDLGSAGTGMPKIPSHSRASRVCKRFGVTLLDGLSGDV